jgi:AraC-like DNA-binding protein
MDIHANLNYVGRVPLHPLFQMKEHSHDDVELIVVLRGKMWAKIRGEEIYAETGDVLLYPGNVPHEEQADPQNPVETIFIGWEGSAHDWPLRVHDTDGRIRMLAKWLYDERFSSDECKATISNPFLQAILSEYYKLSAYNEHTEFVRNIRHYIREHLEEPITLDNLAKTAGMSKYHFVRTYKKLSNQTPMASVRTIRVEAARSLLITTNLPLKSIALKVGLGNEYYLCRVFRQTLGLTPGYFRKKTSSHSG